MTSPQPIGYTVAVEDRHGYHLFPEGNEVFPTQADAEIERVGCLQKQGTRYLVVALVPCVVE